MTNLEFPNEFVAIAYQFPYFNITNTLRMDLRGVQIRCRLPCTQCMRKSSMHPKTNAAHYHAVEHALNDPNYEKLGCGGLIYERQDFSLYICQPPSMR